MDKKYALLVIDVQNYFFEKSSPAYLDNGPKILPRVNRLIALAKGRKWPVVYTSHRAPARPGNLMAERWAHLPSGAESRLYRGLAIVPGALKLGKEHFSAFFDTGLEAYLRKKKVTDVAVCGVMTHLCLDTTVRHGFMLGFRPTVISDSCCSKTRKHHQAALLALGHGFARIITTQGFERGLADVGV